MPSIRFRLDQPTLNGLAARVRREYGSDARIVDTEESVVGGIGGFFGRRVIDVTVELPDQVVVDGAHEFDMPKRVGIMALLDDADAQDLQAPPHAPRRIDPTAFAAVVPPSDDHRRTTPVAQPTAAPVVSTERDDFRALLDGLHGDTARGPAPTPRPSPPVAQVVAPEPAVLLPQLPRTVTTRRSVVPAPATIQPMPPAAPVPAPAARRPAGRTLQPVVQVNPFATQVRPGRTTVSYRDEDWTTAAPAAPVPRSRVGHTMPGVAPAPRTHAGDLLLLVGLGDDAVRVAHDVRDRLRVGTVFDGGAARGNTRRRVDDARGALAARAHGVRTGQPVIVAYGVGEADAHDPFLAAMERLDGDQVWAVVDASRRADQTADWVQRVQRRLQVDAVARIRAGASGSPNSSAQIALPEAWSDLAR